MRHITNNSRRWLAGAALKEIKEGPTDGAATGAAALHQLLTDTPAESASHSLLHHLTQAQHDAEQITAALDADPPAFP